jgi:spore coat protein CotH
MNFHQTFRRDNDMKMIELLASEVAHDFNNRLQSIASVLRVIRMHAGARRTSNLGSLTDFRNNHWYVAVEARNLAPLPGDVDFTVGASVALDEWNGNDNDRAFPMVGVPA